MRAFLFSPPVPDLQVNVSLQFCLFYLLSRFLILFEKAFVLSNLTFLLGLCVETVAAFCFHFSVWCMRGWWKGEEGKEMYFVIVSNGYVGVGYDVVVFRPSKHLGVLFGCWEN